jgi:hypothetical protein
MTPEQLDAAVQDVTLRRKFRRPEERVAAGKARIAEPYGVDLRVCDLQRRGDRDSAVDRVVR